jgi:hypothetical protein
VTPAKRTTKSTTKRTAPKRTAPAAKLPDAVRALETFVADVDGDPMIVHAGEVVRTTHAVVKGRESLFEPAVVRVDHA